VLGAIKDAAQDELVQIDRALQRLASGEYRTCARCAGQIAPGRLAAVPYTDRCGSCAG
jgi:RNA polymerase-binding transcription factor DksA